MKAEMLVCWYIFCALLICLVWSTMHRITHSKFRDEDGDVTTEVGYEEDSQGHDLQDFEEVRYAQEEAAAGSHSHRN